MSEYGHDMEESPVLSAEEKATLQKIGVHSLEGAVALAASFKKHGATKSASLERLCAKAAPAFPSDLLERDLPLAKAELDRLTAPVEGLHFGLNLERSAYTQAANPIELMNFAGSDSSTPLPPAVRLMEKMQPVRNQEGRGTCAAFSSVALREFYAADGVPLSEQFFYWAGKELDNASNAGMSLEHARHVLEKNGICTAGRWPYNPLPLPGQNEGQGPPPAGAEEEAESYLLGDMKVYYGTDQSLSRVSQFKRILAGDEGRSNGRPIVIGALIFTGCLGNPEVMRTGIMPLPLIVSEETCEGGHAMVVVGYVDDTAAPGGGWFIVRNSWGERFAAESPEAPGHAMMPYAYIEYVPTFMIGPEDIHAPASRKVVEKLEKDAFSSDFCYTLEREKQDMEGRLRPRGLAVVGNPGGAFMEDTPANRRRFIAAGYCWQGDRPVPERLRRDVEDKENAAARAAFCAALDSNIAAAKGSEVPSLEGKKKRGFLFGGPPKFTAVHNHQLSDALLEKFLEKLMLVYGLPQESGLEPVWQKILKEANPFQLYELCSKKETYHIVVVWLTPLRWDGLSLPQAGVVSRQYLDVVQEIVRLWQQEQQGKPVYTCLSIGFCGGKGALQGQVESNGCLLLTCYGEEGCNSSALRFPGPAPEGYSLWDRLLPKMWQDIVAEVEAMLHHLENNGFFGTLSTEKLSEKTGVRPGVVAECFAIIAGKGKYVLKKEGETIFMIKR